MSLNFSNFMPVPYIGQPVGKLIGTFTPLETDPRVQLVKIAWADYGASSNNPNVAISVNLRSQGGPVLVGGGYLDAVRSVYIDNTFSDVPIFVQFTDDLFTVVMPPRSVGWLPVATSVQECTILGVNFVTGNIPTTTIHFSNVDRQGFVTSAQVEAGVQVQLLDSGNGLTPAQVSTNVAISSVSFGTPTADRLLVLAISAIATNASVTVDLTAVVFQPVDFVTPPAVTGFLAFDDRDDLHSCRLKMFRSLTPIINPNYLDGNLSFTVTSSIASATFYAWQLYAVSGYQNINPAANAAAPTIPTASPTAAPRAFSIQTVPGSAVILGTAGRLVTVAGGTVVTGSPLGNPQVASYQSTAVAVAREAWFGSQPVSAEQQTIQSYYANQATLFGALAWY